MEAIFAACDRFQTFLLDGVTGSGKTEVYLGAIERIAGLGRQILVLIPEIGLTPQLVARFRERLTAPIVVLHSELGDQERLEAWLMAREGRASVVIGTRSAVFVPLKEPGMFIVDEEHDTSYKQQQGFRYSARDLAIVRGQRSGVPVVLGSATPSLEILYNVILGRYQHLLLPHRAGGAAEPTIEVLDVRARPFEDSLSQPLLREISQCLERGEQTLLFINRRGFAPVFLCHRCGWVADCPQCDAHLVYHRAAHRLRCHHCGQEQPVPDGCPQCGDPEQGFLGAGTQRVAQALARHFPKARIARVDRDSMRRTGTLEGVLAGIHAGQIDILVGTQMLTKGHHFPNVTLVGILEADGGLFGADFRASERMAQTVIQVAGRAGRGGRPGRVVFQTHHPEHPLLQSLVQHGYRHFAQAALEERRAAGLPPYTCMALLRAEAAVREPSLAFLQQARDLAGPLLQGSVSVFGPVPAPMERRAGRYRSQLLLESRQRQALQGMLSAWLPQVDKLKSGFRVRWSLDVDPVDMF
jgi:primosomal protein N' (replication factor Y)